MAAFVTTGCVERGRFRMRHAERFAAWLKPQKPGEFVVTVERLRATRSQAFNRFYFACLVRPFADCTGYTVNEAHEILRAKFFPKDVAAQRRIGAIIGDLVIGAETKKLSHDEFHEYVMSIREWLSDTLGITTERPDLYELQQDVARNVQEAEELVTQIREDRHP